MANTLKEKIKQRIMRSLSPNEQIEEAVLKARIIQIAKEMISRENPALPENDRNKLIDEVVNEITGLGPLEALLRDPLVNEIMINGPKKVYIEKSGKKQLTDIVFEDDNQIMHLASKMLAPTRRHVDETSPYTEVSLNDGSRVNIIIPPLALDGPIITIRKFSKSISRTEDLINLGTLDRRMADFLIACIKAKINIVFSGATGAGKTTTLNVLSSYIDNNERVVTIEDTAELALKQDHVVRLEARLPSIEGRGEITIRELFRNSLRMRPDRIILGEVRGNEALDMLQAICSGHGGSLSVLHAKSPQDAIYRIETMILSSAVPIRLEAIHRQIATTLDLIVQHEQLKDGSRKITKITQVNGFHDGQVVLEDIFVYELEGFDATGKIIGRWKATGIIPLVCQKFNKLGIDLPTEIFNKD